jgi:hypothetical protein
MVIAMMMMEFLLHELNFVKWKTHYWQPWRGCSMNVFLQLAVGISNTIITPHLMQKLVMKTQVLDMNFMATLVVVVVVGGMLVVTTGVDEDAVVAAMCSLTMRSLKILMLNMMIMQILLQHMGHMGSAMSTVVVQVIMWNIIMVVTIEMIRIILLESS